MKQTDASIRLRSRNAQIVTKWVQRVRSEIAASGKQSDERLLNRLPEFLSSLANVISTTANSPSGERFVTENLENCREHGASRAQTAEYTLDQVIREYKVLREIIFEELEKDAPMSIAERDKLLGAVDCGITQAATEFAARRGFRDARVSQAEESARVVQVKLNASQFEVQELQTERNIRESFVAALSHDLRTPITAIRASAELILRHAQDDLGRRLAVRIIDDVERTDRMIRDLLDANRIRAGERLPLRIEEFDLVKLARTTLHELSSVHGDRFLLSGDVEIIGKWSPQDLRRVIENLVGNAVKYGDAYVPITVHIETEDHEVVLSVHNEGNPIPSEVQADLFQQHHRLGFALKGQQKGWGLGLTLVEGIVAAHGGTVSADSAPDRGTTFFVRLPKEVSAQRKANA